MDGGSLEADGYQSVSTDERIHLPAGRINGIVLEQRGITAGAALRLTRLFGNSAQFRMDLQTRYELESAFEASADGIDKVIHPHAA
jgi:antitoxin HigA-1